MDIQALTLSLWLGGLTVICLFPIGIYIARTLAWRIRRGKGLVEALITLPLVLPPTVLGFYFLAAFGGSSPLGAAFEGLFGSPLVFSFAGLVVASVLINLPFAVQPMLRGFEAIPGEVREAAAVSGMAPARIFWRIELPLAWPGILTGLVLTFAHTLGEFGVVLMVGGNIPGQTRTISIAIYDRVQAFDMSAAGAMSGLLLSISLAALAITYALSGHVGRRHG